jgi:hypothetical protein
MGGEKQAGGFKAAHALDNGTDFGRLGLRQASCLPTLHRLTR